MTTKVMYHGTSVRFDVFDRKKIGSVNGTIEVGLVSISGPSSVLRRTGQLCSNAAWIDATSIKQAYNAAYGRYQGYSNRLWIYG